MQGMGGASLVKLNEKEWHKPNSVKLFAWYFGLIYIAFN